MTAETLVSVADGQGTFQRRAFASRADDVFVLRIAGSGKQTAEISFAALPATSEKDQKMIDEEVKSTNRVAMVFHDAKPTNQRVKSGLLFFSTLFAHENRYNPNIGYEAVGKVIAKGGECTERAGGISITDADEILVLVKIQPLLKAAKVEANVTAVTQKLNALNARLREAPRAARKDPRRSHVTRELFAQCAERRPRQAERAAQQGFAADGRAAREDRARV